MSAIRPIDYDRGVHIRQMATTGMDVYMYVDQPGVFLDAFGREIPASIAQEAGFDTERLLKERAKRERQKAAFEQIEAEMSGAVEVEDVVVEERDGYVLKNIGLGRHQVLDTDGNVLTPVPVPLEVAKLLFDRLAPQAEPEKQRKGKKAE